MISILLGKRSATFLCPAATDFGAIKAADQGNGCGVVRQMKRRNGRSGYLEPFHTMGTYATPSQAMLRSDCNDGSRAGGSW